MISFYISNGHWYNDIFGSFLLRLNFMLMAIPTKTISLAYPWRDF